MKIKDKLIKNTWSLVEKIFDYYLDKQLKAYVPPQKKHLIEPDYQQQIINFITQNPVNCSTVYLLEIMPEIVVTSTMVGRIGGAAIGVSQAQWPCYQQQPMDHVITIDLSETPELKHGKLSNARAIAVFIKDKIDNQAYEPLTNEVSIRILSEQDIQQGEYSPQQTDAATAYQLVPFVVPDFVFKEFYLLSTQEKEIKQAWDHIWSAYIGGQATWIQNEEYEGQFIGQLSDLTDELNLGDNGVLYIFANTAFWQCH